MGAIHGRPFIHSFIHSFMPAFPNLERSAFRPGEYVGHACGPWHVSRSNGRRGPWLAVHAMDATALPVYAPTLAEISRRLAAFARDRATNPTVADCE